MDISFYVILTIIVASFIVNAATRRNLKDTVFSAFVVLNAVPLYFVENDYILKFVFWFQLAVMLFGGTFFSVYVLHSSFHKDDDKIDKI